MQLSMMLLPFAPICIYYHFTLRGGDAGEHDKLCYFSLPFFTLCFIFRQIIIDHRQR
jgi:hypothetical protein